MTSPRVLADVLEEVIELVPEEQEQLRKRLTSVRESALYTAPEDMAQRWRAGHSVLFDVLSAAGKGANGWCLQVANVWSGRPVDAASLVAS